MKALGSQDDRCFSVLRVVLENTENIERVVELLVRPVISSWPTSDPLTVDI